MKEICVDARMAFHSGIGTYIRHLLPHLKSAFPSLRVLTSPALLHKWPSLSHYDLILYNALPYSAGEQAAYPFKVPSCDLFWSPHYNIPLLPIRAKKRLVTIHDTCHLAFSAQLSLSKKVYAKTLINAAAAFSDRIITASTFAKQEIVKYTRVSPSKITLIPHGVDRAYFSRSYSAEESEYVKALYKLPPHYFLFVSSLAYHKNIERLLQSWVKVIKHYPEWFLVIAGKPTAHLEYMKVFDQFPHLRSKVLFLGSVDNQSLPHLYQRAYGSILPSLYEGFGLTPLEAMAAGCPTLVSNVASFPEICEDASLYVDPFDPEDIAAKIGFLIQNPSERKMLIEKGLKRHSVFSWEKSANQHIELMDSL